MIEELDPVAGGGLPRGFIDRRVHPAFSPRDDEVMREIRSTPTHGGEGLDQAGKVLPGLEAADIEEKTIRQVISRADPFMNIRIGYRPESRRCGFLRYGDSFRPHAEMAYEILPGGFADGEQVIRAPDRVMRLPPR